MRIIDPKEAMNLLNSYKKQAQSYLGNNQDLDRFLRQVEKKLASIPMVGKDFAVVPSMLLLLKAYAAGRYKAVPYGTILAITAALLYLLNPFDVIPDVLPVVGMLDDVAVIKACISCAQLDLEAFKAWQVK